MLVRMLGQGSENSSEITLLVDGRSTFWISLKHVQVGSPVHRLIYRFDVCPCFQTVAQQLYLVSIALVLKASLSVLVTVIAVEKVVSAKTWRHVCASVFSTRIRGRNMCVCVCMFCSASQWFEKRWHGSVRQTWRNETPKHHCTYSSKLLAKPSLHCDIVMTLLRCAWLSLPLEKTNLMRCVFFCISCSLVRSFCSTSIWLNWFENEGHGRRGAGAQWRFGATSLGAMLKGCCPAKWRNRGWLA